MENLQDSHATIPEHLSNVNPTSPNKFESKYIAYKANIFYKV